MGEDFIGDDCALLPGARLVTSDTLVDTTHFRTDWVCLEELGFKAVAVNLSDVAAMSGRPGHIMVNLTLPAGFSEDDFVELYQGIQNCAQAYRVKVAGGDLTAGPVLSITITVLADVHESGVMTRAGASVGDWVIATGDFGSSAAGLWCLKSGIHEYEYVLDRHKRPSPRLQESWKLVEQSGGTGAMMDASDGLADALYQISRESRISMAVDLAKIPVHEQTREVADRAGVDPLEWALYGGEDYELVACVSQSIWTVMDRDNPGLFVPIGKVTGVGATVELLDQGELYQLDMSKAYMHWR